MKTTTKRGEALLEIADTLLDEGVDDEYALLNAICDLQLTLPGLKPDELRGYRFRVLVEEREHQRKVENQDIDRPSDQSWSDMETVADQRVADALAALIGGHR